MRKGLFNKTTKLIPKCLKRLVEDRIFYVIFNSSRVTNDAYGWRPDQKTKQ